jgi:phenylacetate-CoA ligase
MQYLQKEKGKLLVKIIKGNNFTDDDANQYLRHFQKSFGAENEVEIQYVSQLDKLPNGKFQPLISEL